MAQQAAVQRCKGKVISFNNTRGFGFIKPDDGGLDDVFVHHSSIQSQGFRTLPKGAIVEFSYGDSDGNRLKAADVTLVHNASNRFGGGGGGGGGGECYKCGVQGHLARNCVNGGGGGDGGCYNCGDHGHLARNCTAESGTTGGGGDGACYNCGKTGHFARECRNSGRSIECYTCGGVGHFARECPSQSTDRDDKCFECGKHGHFARNCPLKN